MFLFAMLRVKRDTCVTTQSKTCHFMEGNLVKWRNKQQSLVAQSRDEVEYKAMAQGVFELL